VGRVTSVGCRGIILGIQVYTNGMYLLFYLLQVSVHRMSSECLSLIQFIGESISLVIVNVSIWEVAEYYIVVM
jgi:hypothetical protein